MIIKGLNFIQTTSSCPEQYDVRDADGNLVGYIRLRFGSLICRYPNIGTDSEEIYSADISDALAGSFESEKQRKYYLDIIANRILEKINLESNKNSNNKEGELRIRWDPQIGFIDKSFYVSVESLEEAKKILDILAAYDAFLLQNKIRSDYCNGGLLEVYNSHSKKWEIWHLETGDICYEDIDQYFSDINDRKINKFTNELFSQIDWKKIEEITK